MKKALAQVDAFLFSNATIFKPSNGEARNPETAKPLKPRNAAGIETANFDCVQHK